MTHAESWISHTMTLMNMQLFSNADNDQRVGNAGDYGTSQLMIILPMPLNILRIQYVGLVSKVNRGLTCHTDST